MVNLRKQEILNTYLNLCNAAVFDSKIPRFAAIARNDAFGMEYWGESVKRKRLSFF